MFQLSPVAKASPLVPVLLHIHKSGLHALPVLSCRASTTAAEAQPLSQEPGWKIIPIDGAVEITEFLPRMNSKLNNNECVWINALSGSPDTDGLGSAKCYSLKAVCTSSGVAGWGSKQVLGWWKWTVLSNKKLSSMNVLLKRSSSSVLEKLLQLQNMVEIIVSWIFCYISIIIFCVKSMLKWYNSSSKGQMGFLEWVYYSLFQKIF